MQQTRKSEDGNRRRKRVEGLKTFIDFWGVVRFSFVGQTGLGAGLWGFTGQCCLSLCGLTHVPVVLEWNRSRPDGDASSFYKRRSAFCPEPPDHTLMVCGVSSQCKAWFLSNHLILTYKQGIENYNLLPGSFPTLSVIDIFHCFFGGKTDKWLLPAFFAAIFYKDYLSRQQREMHGMLFK